MSILSYDYLQVLRETSNMAFFQTLKEATMARLPDYATKQELIKHKKEVQKMIKDAIKGVKKWDVKQDNKLIKKSSKPKKVQL
jgi:TfoX/Sxy family transcriptional regulator of competence genes